MWAPNELHDHHRHHSKYGILPGLGRLEERGVWLQLRLLLRFPATAHHSQLWFQYEAQEILLEPWKCSDIRTMRDFRLLHHILGSFLFSH